MRKMEDMSKEGGDEERRDEKKEKEQKREKREKRKHQGGTGAGKTIRRGRGRAPGSKRGRNRST